MLEQRNRLKKKKDFDKILKTKKSFKERFLILKLNKNKLKDVRFGVIVSQKVSKKAVVRNKIKRRFRSVLKDSSQNLKKGFDIVLIALPGAETKSFLEIRSTIEKLLRLAGLSKPKNT